MTNTRPQVPQPKNKPADKPVAAPLKTKAVAGETPHHAKKVTEDSFVFGKRNYQVMVIGLVVITLGFFLMYGREDIFSTMKITVAPIVVLLGFAIEVVAIMIKAEPADEHP